MNGKSMISEVVRTDISNLISRHFGISFLPAQWGELERKLTAASVELKFTNLREFLKYLLDHRASPEQLEELATFLTVGETYFFREKTGLDFFRQVILPDLMESKRGGTKSLSIWSAGCCTGEEPYTIAMILAESIPDLTDWKISILGTDLNKKYIFKASQASYTNWSFRETPDWAMKKYFIPNKNEYQLVESIRRMVNFRIINLPDTNEFPSDFIPEESVDVIYCRNVLMYFSPQEISNVSMRFRQCLRPDGWLITSPVEVSNPGFSNFTYVPFQGWGALQKRKRSGTINPGTNTHKIQDKRFPAKSIGRAVIPGQKPSNNVKANGHQVKKTLSDSCNNELKSGKLVDESLFSQASIQFKQGDYSGVVNRLEKYLSKNPNDPKGLNLLIQSLANTGELEKALNLCEKSINGNTENASLYLLMGTILLEMNDPKEAEKALRKALYIDHELINAHFILANLMKKQGNIKLAAKHFKNVIKLVKSFGEDQIVPELDGISVNQLKGMVNQFI
jgi:chemotaxis protein methyltransferase CheR